MSSFSVMSVNDGNVWCWKVVIAVGGVTGYDKSDGIVIGCTHVTDSRSWPCTHTTILLHQQSEAVEFLNLIK